MIRKTMLFVALLVICAANVRADDPPYRAIMDARRAGESILVSMKIVQMETRNGVLTTTTRSTPRVMVRDGQRAQLMVGQPKTNYQPTSQPSGDSEIESGIRTDVISIKGADHVLVMITVIENGLVIWAESQTVGIGETPPPDDK